MYKTFLYFYSAISYEILGRSAHNYSKNKIPLLHQALDCFITCSAVLPSVLPVPEAATVFDFRDYDSPPPLMGDLSSLSEWTGASASPVGSLVNCITQIIERSIDSPEDDPFVSDNEPQVDYDDGDGDGGAAAAVAASFQFGVVPGDKSKGLLPSPLRIRKSPGDLASVFASANGQLTGQLTYGAEHPTARGVSRPAQPARSRRPPPLPLKIVPPSGRKTNTLDHDDDENYSTTSSCASSKTVIVKRNKQKPPAPYTPTRLAAIKHYNSNIQSLRSQISSSISAIYSLIDDVTELQRMRRASKVQRSASFWSFSPVKDHEGESKQDRKSFRSASGTSMMETKEQRIARLRAEGWSTVGLKSGKRGWKGVEYYRAYCGSVLDELYLD